MTVLFSTTVLISGQNPETIPKVIPGGEPAGFVGHKTGHSARGCVGTISYSIENTMPQK